MQEASQHVIGKFEVITLVFDDDAKGTTLETEHPRATKHPLNCTSSVAGAFSCRHQEAADYHGHTNDSFCFQHQYQLHESFQEMLRCEH